MTTYFLIDSNDREIEDSVSNFILSSKKTSTWTEQSRITETIPDEKWFFVPKLSEVTVQDLYVLSEETEPFVKLVFFNVEFNDIVYNSTDGETSIRFFLRNQKESIHYGKKWTRFTSNMIQIMRFRKRGSFVFKVLDKDNKPISAERIIANISVK
jgi:hypothetical protein